MSNTVRSDDREAYMEAQRDEAAKNLARFAKKFDMHAPRQLVRFGLHAPAEELLGAAREEAADLVVLGTEGRNTVSRFFLGSVAEAVLRGADRDVLAVPPSLA
jgi:nucleotide-binding universal stress UspA family protein